MAGTKIIIRKGKAFPIAQHLDIWQFNIKTGEIKRAALRQQIDHQGMKTYVLDENDTHFYLPADGELNAYELFGKTFRKSTHEPWYQRLTEWFYYLILSIRFFEWKKLFKK
jgi:hypothetical protein